MKIHDQMIVGEEEIPIKDLYYVVMKCLKTNASSAKRLIKSSKVQVNDQMMTDIKYQVTLEDDIKINQEHYDYPFVYYMLHKPKGYVSANSDPMYPCVTDLVSEDVSCIGRLDLDTTGLLLLTNDVNHMKQLLYPENHHNKKYLVTLDHPLEVSLIEQFEKGIQIPNYLCLPAFLEIVSDYQTYITIQEGKYHQIKKMFYSCGYKVVELHRVTFGPLVLDEHLPIGKARKLTHEEIQLLEESIHV